MNKKTINGYLPKAYELLNKAGVAEKGTINKMFRGYISSFGAAIAMGSLKAAIAAYSAKGSAVEHREKLIDIIYALIENKSYEDVVSEQDNNKASNNNEMSGLLKYVNELNDDRKAEEEILNAAIAVKLAMNMYDLK